MLQRGVPFSGARQEDRDRLLRFDIHLNVAAVPGRVIRQPRMVVRGVQPHTLVVAGLPIENSLLPVRWPGERTHQQEREKERRSEEHTSELQSRLHLVCRLLLEKKNYCPLLTIQLTRSSSESRPWRRGSTSSTSMAPPFAMLKYQQGNPSDWHLDPASSPPLFAH